MCLCTDVTKTNSCTSVELSEICDSSSDNDVHVKMITEGPSLAEIPPPVFVTSGVEENS